MPHAHNLKMRTTEEQRTEGRARRMAKAQGYRLQKSRRWWTSDYRYMVIDQSLNAIRFNADHIDHVIEFLS